MTFWVEAYGRSLVAPDGPWADFARSTVDDWLELLDGRRSAPRADGRHDVPPYWRCFAARCSTCSRPATWTDTTAALEARILGD